MIPSSRCDGYDVGSGDGQIANLLLGLRPELHLEGFDVLIRPRTHIKTHRFDGRKLPAPDKSVDFTLLVDVLHHAADQETLLAECRRVSRSFILIKDHFCESAWDQRVLQFMDWVGNAGHGVDLPYNYLSDQQWKELFSRLRLTPGEIVTRLGLYPFPFSYIFDRRLHFISKLSV
jgi:SAM-dependent methyltransferase